MILKIRDTCPALPAALCATLLTALGGGCRRPAATVRAGETAAGPVAGEVVATVDGRAITADQVRRQAVAAAVPPRAALADLIDAELLFAEARRRGLEADPEVHAVLAAALARRELAETFEKEVTREVVTEAEIRASYARHADELDRPELRVVAHVLVPFGKPPPDAARQAQLRARAEQVLARARAARSLDDFKAIGPALSDATATLLVEELATGPSGYTVKPFADAAFALTRPGQTSGIVESSFGYHVIWLKQVQPPFQVPLDQVRERLRDGIWPDIRRREFARYLDPLVEKHRIEVHPERLEDGEAR